MVSVGYGDRFWRAILWRDFWGDLPMRESGSGFFPFLGLKFASELLRFPGPAGASLDSA
ncbi:MAG: hypothetical protein P5702_19230 [Limnospira sp. PMC 1291.21]|nr:MULTISPECIES: hypothetical protein [unclassified Limnospira]MDC0839241.1 hypothetical protein [Limnoraphis robusta]MDY7055544.1 hypothetical protein [Limnospira fusiformis LS22]QJB25320.1 hypothetical protein HFV01_05295 [Limnospira fusiformis SAG 85.79]MDT9177898.1 hypothetical protein [Limnospira sp. PMC 1238.20]MDT9189945.1 hypothetical protein [Limnospira sp. PMC 894.15]